MRAVNGLVQSFLVAGLLSVLPLTSAGAAAEESDAGLTGLFVHYYTALEKGWWAEAFDGANGFAIGLGDVHSSAAVHDARDGAALLRVLREEVVPLYYERDADGLPRERIRRARPPGKPGRLLVSGSHHRRAP